MQIKIDKKYRSIDSQSEFELPDFAVITGKNGSGKTHLLEAISRRNISTVEINGQIIQKVRYIAFNGLNPNITEKCNEHENNIHIHDISTTYTHCVNKFQSEKPNDIEEFLSHIPPHKKNLMKFIQKAIEEADCDFLELKYDNFVDSFDASLMDDNFDMFKAAFALIFKEYHKKLEENRMNEYYQSKKHPQFKPVLSPDEFINKYGTPPWEFVNRVLTDIASPYEVNNPEGDRLYSSFTLKFRDKKKGFEVSTNDLSTGERVLMALLLAIYNGEKNFSKPDLLLLDEPDAGLHPSMSKMMIHIIKKYIVEEFQIPTIITSHSPTTIIATEGIAIYQLKRGNSIPKKVSIQDAVEMLSGDIPFLRISTEKRRQVFVESKYDVMYYELLTNIFRELIRLQAEPIFIPARTSNGSNCADVINIVSSLYSNGNDQIYGIVDWDNANCSNDRIIVLGENERYSIENYLLDPLLLGILFIRENDMKINTFGNISITSYAQVRHITENDAQAIINEILMNLNLQSEHKVDYKLFNNWTLQTTKEFNNYQGHDLEKLYKEKFPFLKKYNRETGLKKDVIEKVINDYPIFTPIEISNTLKKIS